MNFFRNFIGIFAQYRCISCNLEITERAALCQSCTAHIEVVNQASSCKKCGRYAESDICYFCRKQMPKFTQAKVYCTYNDVSASIIRGYKYYNNGLCRKFIVDKIVSIYKSQYSHIAIDYVIPVPMNGIKEWIKGYNHTSQIAKDCFSDTNIKILPFALQKKFIFKKQAGSSKKERLANMAGVFYLDTKHRLTGANVLLLDDVMTTGATINECTKVLFEAGVKNVFVLTFAKSIADEEMLKNMEEDSI